MELFKYFPPSRIDVLESGRICFSVAQNFNDPFEMKPPMALYENDQAMASAFEALAPKLISEEYDKLDPKIRALITPERLQVMLMAQFKQRLPEIIPACKEVEPLLSSNLHQKLHAIMGILCLTESHDNLLMWAHYGMSHAGFVMGFDTTHPFFNGRRTDHDELYHVRQVKYSDERPRMVLTQTEDLSAFLTKSQHWAYEREWRMLMPLSAASAVIGDGSRQFHLFDFPKECVKSVHLGCRIAQDDRSRIIELLRSDPSLQRPRCYQAEIDHQYFRLNFKPIEY
ncbi:hypothetical protein FQZ97_359890 [compost metagenome]